MTEPLQKNDRGQELPGGDNACPADKVLIKLHAILPHRLHITELVQTEVRKLTAKTAFLHAAKGHAASLAL
jgi:hypothetical protein